ncbi:MAG TPA: hypothetical protein VF778_11880 [Xanthobacteraceae bacterium]
MQLKQARFCSLHALRPGLWLALAFASPLVTALPAVALPHNTPLAIAQRQEGLTAGGPFDPASRSTAGDDLTVQRGDDLR